MYGLISGNEPTPMYGGQRTLDVAIPSLTAVIIAMAGLMSNTMTMATYREKGILRRLQTTPVSPLIVLAAQVIVIFTMNGLGMPLLVVAGKLVFDVNFTGNVFSLLGGFVLCSMSFFGIGFILAGIMPTVRTTWVASMVLVYPMLLLSGAFFSVEVLPAAVQKVSKFIPLTTWSICCAVCGTASRGDNICWRSACWSECFFWGSSSRRKRSAGNNNNVHKV
ncbi:MAG TPA: ABC transporter permease [Anaerolineae bacterium]|nr:ABC transporter permease [Anaerolineae bacterium]HQI86042.1 ABC transporter permease [Anaerolineae bacterium]